MAMPAVRLYERRDALEIAREWLVEAGGELTPELEALLCEAEGDFDAKIERCLLYLRKREGIVARQREMAQEFATLAAKGAKEVEAFKGYIKHQMEQVGRMRVDGLLPCRIQANPPHVESSLSEGELGDLYGKAPRFVTLVPQQFALDKRAVLEAYRLGQSLPKGVEVKQDTRLSIG